MRKKLFLTALLASMCLTACGSTAENAAVSETVSGNDSSEDVVVEDVATEEDSADNVTAESAEETDIASVPDSETDDVTDSDSGSTDGAVSQPYILFASVDGRTFYYEYDIVKTGYSVDDGLYYYQTSDGEFVMMTSEGTANVINSNNTLVATFPNAVMASEATFPMDSFFGTSDADTSYDDSGAADSVADLTDSLTDLQ